MNGRIVSIIVFIVSISLASAKGIPEFNTQPEKSLKFDYSANKERDKSKQTSNHKLSKEKTDMQYKYYGYLSFSIYPGFKRIRLDRENIIGFAETILVPAGGHWVEIIAPKGYVDTSFKIEVKSNESLNIVVQLKDIISGKPAPISDPDKKKVKKRGAFWSILEISCFVGGLATGYLAYDYEQSASESYKKYNSLDPTTPLDQRNKDFKNTQKNIENRNIMAAASGTLILIGIFLWIFR